jgi:hypothetical protein
MSTTTVGADVRDYLAAVRDHLDDLPVDERDDLLEDLEAHLLEVAAESDEPLGERLGPPDAYAADLRASAGLPPTGGTLDVGRRFARVRQRWQRLAAHPTVQRVRAFLPELRPGWWVLRAVLAVWVLAMVRGDVDASDIPFPPLFGSRFVGLIAMIAAVPLSVRLGHRQGGNRRLTRTVHFGEVLLLVLTIPLLTDLRDERTVWVDYGPGLYEVHGGVLIGPNGEPISNFYATDANGNPIEHFRLYDESGTPVTNVLETDDYSNPDGVLRTQIPLDRDGRPVPNGYPRDAWLERYDGSTESLTPPVDATATTTSVPSPSTISPAATTLPPDTATTAPE